MDDEVEALILERKRLQVVLRVIRPLIVRLVGEFHRDLAAAVAVEDPAVGEKTLGDCIAKQQGSANS